MKRRKFFRSSFAATSGIIIAGSSVCSCSFMGVSNTASLEQGFKWENNLLSINLSEASLLKEIGSSVKLSLNDHDQTKLLIIHQKEGHYLVFDNKCTHGGAEVEYQDDKLRCSSFGHSQYNLQGQVLKGPAPRPLKSYRSRIEGDQLVVDLS